jgi:hypothetical protein
MALSIIDGSTFFWSNQLSSEAWCVSKRSWEKGQQHWRHQIRRWVLLYGYVPACVATSASTQSARSIAVISAVFRPQECVCEYVPRASRVVPLPLRMVPGGGLALLQSGSQRRIFFWRNTFVES